jgi:hypothetical protein
MKKSKIFSLALLSMSIGGIAHAEEPTAHGLASLNWTCVQSTELKPHPLYAQEG